MERLGNDFATTLAAAITTVGQTSIQVVSNAGAPSARFRIRVGDELMIVAANPSTTWTVERGAEGTTPTTHPASADVAHVVTAGGLETYLRESGQFLKAEVADGDTLVVPEGHQLLVGSGFMVSGSLQLDGDLHMVS